MEYIQLGVVILVLLLIFTAIIGIWMRFANKIGEQVGIGKFFFNLCKNIGRGNK